jgi:hypothetical protein
LTKGIDIRTILQMLSEFYDLSKVEITADHDQIWFHPPGYDNMKLSDPFCQKYLRDENGHSPVVLRSEMNGEDDEFYEEDFDSQEFAEFEEPMSYNHDGTGLFWDREIDAVSVYT